MAENNEVAAAPKKSRLKTILLLIVVLGLAIGLSIAGTLWFLSDGDGSGTAEGDEEAESADEAFVPASYLVMDKPLVTSISNPGRQRYVQAYLALESSEEAALEAARKHLPLLRNALISELATSEFVALQTVEGRQALPERLLATVNETLAKEGEPAVDRVLLRNFVIQ